MVEFSIDGMAKQFLSLSVGGVILDEAMLEYVGVTVEKAAKDKIGEYQGQAGQFVGWAQLADSTMDDRVRQGFSEDEPGLRSGKMRDSIEHKVGFQEVQIGSDDDNLVWFELGTVKQPPRSVLGGAAFEEAPKIVEHLGVAMEAFLIGKGVFQGRMKIE
jgi:hypothetical protein